MRQLSSRSRFRPSLIALALGACRGSYPLEPTPCDDWCDAVSSQRCNGPDPANCVLGCEQSGLVPHAPECQAAWQTALACYRSLPESSGACVGGPVISDSSGEVPCQLAYEELMKCGQGADISK